MSIMKRSIYFVLLFALNSVIVFCQPGTLNFRIRTITAGIEIKSLSDTSQIKNAIIFLKKAEKEFVSKGYEVQTLRIATSNLHTYINNYNLTDALPFLKQFD